MPTTLPNAFSMAMLRNKLSEHLSKSDVLSFSLQTSDISLMEQLYLLLFDSDERIASNAAWICTHWNNKQAQWLIQKHDQLIEAAIHTPHPTQRRLLLTLLYRQQQHIALRTDLLNFCLQSMIACQEPNSIRTLCIKLAYAQCSQHPDLLEEFRLTLELMEHDLLPPSLRSVRKHALQAIEQKKPFI